jgi:hypothetical protein
MLQEDCAMKRQNTLVFSPEIPPDLEEAASLWPGLRKAALLEKIRQNPQLFGGSK